MLEANKKQVPRKSHYLNIRSVSVNQILKNKEKVTSTRNKNILTRITDPKILCVCIFMSIKYLKTEDLARTILYITLIIENTFRVSL